jgi:hypothetical protein
MRQGQFLIYQCLWRTQINMGYVSYKLRAVRTVYLPNRILKYNLANVLHGFCSRKLFAGLLVSSVIRLTRD